MTYYKFLTDRNTGGHQDYQWPLPEGEEPGEWTPEVEGELVICDNGYHVLDSEHLHAHIQANLYEVEIDGKGHVEGDGKHAVRRARLLRKLDGWNIDAVHLFALDCAIKVFPIFGARHPNDTCVRNCIIATQKFLGGNGSKEELKYWAAIWAAEAAWATAAARSAAETETAAEVKAAVDAAWNAAWDAGDKKASMCHWQSARVLKYAHGAASPLALPERILGA